MAAVIAPARLPDHKQLPDTDGKPVENFQEHPQGSLLTDSIWPVLKQRHPDGQFCIGHDSGIYWRITERPLDGCKSPDWFYVPDVPPTLGGEVRRSYVLWQEHMPPFVILEFVSGTGAEERDQTPWEGKFWVYERIIRPAYYGIYEVDPGRVEVHHLVDGRFQRLPANERGHYALAPLGVELGIWQGEYRNLELPWLRWWDAQGQLLPSAEERVQQEQQLKEQAQQQAEQAQQQAEQERLAREQSQRRAERLAEQLRALGIDPEG
jgi:Uma2 family endonuclease